MHFTASAALCGGADAAVVVHLSHRLPCLQELIDHKMLQCKRVVNRE